MSKREIKTIFFSIGSLSLIIEGEFLFKHDVSHLSFCSCRQVVPRHGVCWEHPVFLRTPEESRLALSSSRVRTKMISRSTVIQNALAFSKYPFHGKTGAEQHQRVGRSWPRRLKQCWDSSSGDHGEGKKLRGLAKNLLLPRGQRKVGRLLAVCVDRAAKSWPGFTGALWFLTLLHKRPSQPLCVSGT